MVARRVVWAVTSVLLVAGATWFVALALAPTSLVDHGYLPGILGPVLAALTLARALHHRPVLLAAFGTAAWLGLQLLARTWDFIPAAWTMHLDPDDWTGRELAVLTTVATALAALAGALRLPGRRDHGLLWAWISALVFFGGIQLIATLDSHRHLGGGVALLAFACPLFAGALTQYLAPKRMLWICGSGALLLSLLIIDDGVRHPHALLYSLLLATFGPPILVPVGATGALVAWGLFRRSDRTTPPAFPSARVV